MSTPKGLHFLDKARDTIAQQVRDLRKERGWTQAELADKLALSQSRLSEVERGKGSLTAEQLLLVLQLFNVSPASFLSDPPTQSAALQNALARLGATHLRESDRVVPDRRHDDILEVVRDALLDGSPRFVTALAPVLLDHTDVNLRRAYVSLDEHGFGRRIPWLLENTLAGVDILRASGRDTQHWSAIGRKATVWQLFLKFLDLRHDIRRDDMPPDVLDPAIRTKRTADEVQSKASEFSRRWNIISSLHPSDFAEAIRSALGPR